MDSGDNITVSGHIHEYYDYYDYDYYVIPAGGSTSPPSPALVRWHLASLSASDENHKMDIAKIFTISRPDDVVREC